MNIIRPFLKFQIRILILYGSLFVTVGNASEASNHIFGQVGVFKPLGVLQSYIKPAPYFQMGATLPWQGTWNLLLGVDYARLQSDFAPIHHFTGKAGVQKKVDLQSINQLGNTLSIRPAAIGGGLALFAMRAAESNAQKQLLLSSSESDYGHFLWIQSPALCKETLCSYLQTGWDCAWTLPERSHFWRVSWAIQWGIL
jgi:hypothetical protein